MYKGEGRGERKEEGGRRKEEGWIQTESNDQIAFVRSHTGQ